MSPAELEIFSDRFADAGLPLPSLERFAPADLRLRSDWHLTSRSDEPASPYLVDRFVREFVEGDPGDYVVVAHAGHGTASWAVSYLETRGPIGVFVQGTWGRSYASEADLARQAAGLRERVAAADEVLAAPTGSIAPDERLIVVDSDVHGRSWATVRRGEPVEWRHADDPLGEALAHLRRGSAPTGEGSPQPAAAEAPQR